MIRTVWRRGRQGGPHLNHVSTLVPHPLLRSGAHNNTSNSEQAQTVKGGGVGGSNTQTSTFTLCPRPPVCPGEEEELGMELRRYRRSQPSPYPPITRGWSGDRSSSAGSRSRSTSSSDQRMWHTEDKHEEETHEGGSMSVRGREWHQYVGVCGEQRRERGRRGKGLSARRRTGCRPAEDQHVGTFPPFPRGVVYGACP